mgnify:CR=1 FL=1
MMTVARIAPTRIGGIDSNDCAGCHELVGWTLVDDPRAPSTVEWLPTYELDNGSLLCEMCAERLRENGPLRPDLIVRHGAGEWLVLRPSVESVYGPFESSDIATAFAEDLADRYPSGATIVIERERHADCH